MKNLILLLFVASIASGCKKEEKSSDTPTITYEVTGTHYLITAYVGFDLLSRASVANTNGVTTTTKTYSFKAKKGDRIVFSHSGATPRSLKISNSNPGTSPSSTSYPSDFGDQRGTIHFDVK